MTDLSPALTIHATPALVVRLTPRQVQVLQCLVDGMTTRQTALFLGISPSTVNVYVKRAADRLGAMSRAQVVGMAVSFGLITIHVNRLTTR